MEGLARCVTSFFACGHCVVVPAGSLRHVGQGLEIIERHSPGRLEALNIEPRKAHGRKCRKMCIWKEERCNQNYVLGMPGVFEFYQGQCGKKDVPLIPSPLDVVCLLEATSRNRVLKPRASNSKLK